MLSYSVSRLCTNCVRPVFTRLLYVRHSGMFAQHSFCARYIIRINSVRCLINLHNYIVRPPPREHTQTSSPESAAIRAVSATDTRAHVNRGRRMKAQAPSYDYARLVVCIAAGGDGCAMLSAHARCDRNTARAHTGAQALRRKVVQQTGAAQRGSAFI